MAKKKDSLDVILEDVTKKYNKAVKDMAVEVAYKIEAAYESAIEAFYNDYPDPIYYDRTYSTYLGSNAYDDVYNYGIQQFGNSYFAGINVSSSNIPGNPYRAYKGWVFDRTFEQGIHGINRNDLIKMNKPRSKDDHIKRKVIKNMTPPPRVLMDKAFKELTKKGSLDKIAMECLAKNGLN